MSGVRCPLFVVKKTTDNLQLTTDILFRFAFCILIFFLAGCSSNAIVTVRPIQSHDALSITFTRAFYLKDDSGQDQIVLENNPIDEPPRAAPGDPLPVVISPPLLQVLLIQLHWRSVNAGRSDSPVADNAVLHWYVYGKPDERGTALLHYIGTGAVSVAPDSTGADVFIHHAELHLTQRRGNLRDPLADFHINSRFHALGDATHFDQVMADLQTAVGEALK